MIINPYQIEFPLFDDIGYIPNSLSVKKLKIELCRTDHAVNLVRLWHSRLPNCQDGPWQFAFKAHFGGVTLAVALWNNPSARTLPHHWIELRRMAASKEAPKNTCSYMLSRMTKYFEDNYPEREKCISYQDIKVHDGTIYKAANWFPEMYSKPRKRDRSKLRKGTSRNYRKDINSLDVASSPKIRWCYILGNNCIDHKKVKSNLNDFYALAKQNVTR